MKNIDKIPFQSLQLHNITISTVDLTLSFSKAVSTEIKTIDIFNPQLNKMNIYSSKNT